MLVGGPCIGTKDEAMPLRIGKFSGAVIGMAGGGYLTWDFLSQGSKMNLGLEIMLTVLGAGIGNQLGRGIGVAIATGFQKMYGLFSHTDIEEKTSSDEEKRLLPRNRV